MFKPIRIKVRLVRFFPRIKPVTGVAELTGGTCSFVFDCKYNNLLYKTDSNFFSLSFSADHFRACLLFPVYQTNGHSTFGIINLVNKSNT